MSEVLSGLYFEVVMASGGGGGGGGVGVIDREDICLGLDLMSDV